MSPFIKAEASTVKGVPRVTYIDEEGNKEIKVGGSRSWRNNNPGNTRNISSAIGRDKGKFDIFADEETGRQAKITIIKNKYGEYSSIRQMLKGKFDSKGNFIMGSGYAPACDANDPDHYAEVIHKKTGLDVESTQIKKLTEVQITQLVDAIKMQEGWIEGTVTQEPVAKPPPKPK